MKTALITGGTSGIGLSIAKALLQKKYKVFIIGSNKQKGSEIESELNNLYSDKAKFYHLDLSTIKEVKSFARKFVEQNDSLDVLANIAGAMIPDRILTKEGIEKTFSIGYLSAFVLSRELIPLLENVEGRIVNVAGVPSFIFKAKLDFEDISFSKNYSSFKTAITTVHAKTVLTEILSEKYASKGIDVNSFHPGAVRSDLMKNMKVFERLLFKFLSLFMAHESKTGIYVSSSPEINGVSGKFCNKKNAMNLNFESEYKERLWEVTEDLLRGI